jgi:soluble lytic murein transglycosylase-like protein
MQGKGRAREQGVRARVGRRAGHRRLIWQLALGAVLASTTALLPTVTRNPVPKEDPSELYDARNDQEARSNAAFDAMDQYFRQRQIELAAGTYAQRFRIPAVLARTIYAAARDEEIPPDVAFGLVRAESSFRPRAVSPAGAVGLTQVLPSTGRWIAPGTTRRDLLDPETNLRVGFRYLRYLYDKYEGDERLALTAYNRGPGTVDRHLKQGRNPDNGYVELVLTGRSRKHTNLMNARFGRRS